MILSHFLGSLLCKPPIGIMSTNVSHFCVALLWDVGWVLYHLWGPRVII